MAEKVYISISTSDKQQQAQEWQPAAASTAQAGEEK